MLSVKRALPGKSRLHLGVGVWTGRIQPAKQSQGEMVGMSRGHGHTVAITSMSACDVPGAGPGIWVCDDKVSGGRSYGYARDSSSRSHRKQFM